MRDQIAEFNEALRVDVDDFDLPDIEIPEARTTHRLGPRPLFDSSWSFAEQCRIDRLHGAPQRWCVMTGTVTEATRTQLRRLINQIDLDEPVRRRAVQQAILEATAEYWGRQPRTSSGRAHGPMTSTATPQPRSWRLPMSDAA
jgi:hypothetical protein